MKIDRTSDGPITGTTTNHVNFMLEALSKQDIPAVVITLSEIGIQVDMNTRIPTSMNMIKAAEMSLVQHVKGREDYK